jgi:hypothetical protein
MRDWTALALQGDLAARRGERELPRREVQLAPMDPGDVAEPDLPSYVATQCFEADSCVLDARCPFIRDCEPADDL